MVGIRLRYCMYFFFVFITGVNSDCLSNAIDAINRVFSDTKKTILVQAFTFKADVDVDTKELHYLTNFHSNKTISKDDCLQAYEYLVRKKRFAHIDFNFLKKSDGYDLEILLTAHWLLKAVHIRGIWFGKYRYASVYQQQQGDVFDILSHEESLNAIKNLLHEEGYFSSTIQAMLERDPQQKMVTVKLFIDRKSVYSIAQPHIEFDQQRADAIDQARLKEEVASKILKELPGAVYSKKKVEKHRSKVKEFLRKKGYPASRLKIIRRIHAQTRKVDLVFKIKLGKKKEITFTGNKAFSDKYLFEKVFNEPYLEWLYDPSIIAERIVHEYRMQGFKKAKVSFKENALGVLSFIIDEGEPLKIKTIRVVSPDSRREPFEHYFQNVFAQGVFNEELFNDAQQRLVYHHVNLGFWDCFTKKVTFDPKNNNEGALVVLLNKGALRILRSIAIVGVDSETEKRFLNTWGFDKGTLSAPCNPEFIKQQKSDLIDYFKEQGYWYVDVQPEFTFTPLASAAHHKNKTSTIAVDLKWRVILGERVTFGKILMRGTSRISFKRIMAEIPFKQGDPWDRRKVDLVRSRLKKFDVFKNVSVQPYNITKKELLKDLIISLDDDDPAEIRFRGGYFLTNKNFLFKRLSTYEVGGTLMVKNPTNAADKFTVGGGATRFEQMINIDYQRPRIFGFHLLSTLKGFSHKYIHPVQLGESKAAYEATQTGILATVHNEYQKNYYWGFSVGNEWFKTSRVRGDLKLSPSLINKTLPYFFIEPTLIIDFLDDRLNPTKGGLTFLSAKYMFPEVEGSMTYRIMAEQSFFYPLAGLVTLGIRVRMGHIFGRNFDHIMPLERFYLGGPHTVRGYEKDAVPPLGVTVVTKPDGTIVKEFTIQGGSSMVNANFEARFPVYNSIGGVIFHDIGALNQKGFALFEGKYVHATGFGLRYNTPVGPLRFDCGRKWEKSFKEQSRYVWYLTLGHAF